ncbi:transglycosylase domain-containing protein [uncultured Erythrobacter sp.]|uniref:transglycosylase domain-containing protein n=1 Tax=uncultured Erythrobacter sp. TaxID=263913 RepID=UPI00263912A8|nr:transglycosylase domain-containing protein [uncultured Erythrobacter sp.]
MGLFERFRRRSSDDDARGGADYFPLYESQRAYDPDDDFGGGTTSRAAPKFSKWDAKLSQLDRSVELEERRRLPWWRPDHYRGRRKRWWAVRAFALAILLFFALVAWLAITAPLSKSLEPIAAPQVTLLASDGTPIARSGAMVDEPVEVADLPPHVIEAFLAIEDRRFYSHWGVDPRGIARAVWTRRGGGSTITQQLAKFTFLTPEQTLTRKAREALIAFWLESWLTKDEILGRYLSNAYFGDNQYGLRAASLHYFYRKPENLKPEQAAMLAGLLQAPSRYAPTKNWDKATARMKQVTGAMVDAGYLTEAERAALPTPKLDVRTRDDLPTGTYFADWALPIARKDMETSYARQVITTTLDARLQALASRVTSRASLGDAQVALVAMRPTGEVVAMVGGKDYATSPFNRATQAKRQPGSTFKLFVYLAALEAGWSPDDTIPNTPIETGSYRPKNSRENYSDEITLEQALSTSSNVAAVRLFNEVGSENVIRMARSLGVTSPLPKGDPSLALGTSSMTLLELTAAYAGVAANEFPVRPHAFEQDDEGWWAWLTTQEDSVSDRAHDDLEQMLRTAINRGTGRAATLPIANYGKTGTTQNYRDALFVGYAGDLVVGIWVGNDDNSPLDKVTGGGLPARIWKQFMRGALSLKPAPRPSASPDPQGPVQPLDVEEGAEIPLDENGSRIRFEQDGVAIETEIEGMPIEFRLSEDGIAVEPIGPDE